MSRLFEDFVPISDTEALITTGWTLDALDQVERTSYTLATDGRVQLGPRLKRVVLTAGKGLRLGGFFNGGPLWSEAGKGIMWHGRRQALPDTAHQPFVHDGSLYYTDDWPYVRIYRDGEILLGHFGEMIQVANPCLTPDGTMFFEARATDHPERADLWEIWRRTPAGELSFICMGANPAYWNDRLFVGTWNGRHFDYRARTL